MNRNGYARAQFDPSIFTEWRDDEWQKEILSHKSCYIVGINFNKCSNAKYWNNYAEFGGIVHIQNSTVVS